jgi:hypothetical protein
MPRSEGISQTFTAVSYYASKDLPIDLGAILGRRQPVLLAEVEATAVDLLDYSRCQWVCLRSGEREQWCDVLAIAVFAPVNVAPDP